MSKTYAKQPLLDGQYDDGNMKRNGLNGEMMSNHLTPAPRTASRTASACRGATDLIVAIIIEIGLLLPLYIVCFIQLYNGAYFCRN
jgi:hypothetical protein